MTATELTFNDLPESGRRTMRANRKYGKFA